VALERTPRAKNLIVEKECPIEKASPEGIGDEKKKGAVHSKDHEALAASYSAR
jgi:hypothetical protein